MSSQTAELRAENERLRAALKIVNKISPRSTANGVAWIDHRLTLDDWYKLQDALKALGEQAKG